LKQEYKFLSQDIGMTHFRWCCKFFLTTKT